MKVETYKCDECGALKREANHWFWAIAGCGRFNLALWTAPIGTLTSSTESSIMHPEKIVHLCGQDCAHKAMMKAMTMPEGGGIMGAGIRGGLLKHVQTQDDFDPPKESGFPNLEK